MKLVTVAEMRAIEQQANAGGLSFNQMMSNAGLGLAGIIKNYYSPENEKWVVGLVGSGNNGGDTLVALSELAGEGWHACAYLLQARKKGDALVKSLTVAGGLVIEMGQDLDFTQLDKWLGNCAVLLDGVLGTGIRLPLKPDAANLLEHVQQYRPLPHVVAVDCPSGVDCENGKAASECIPAELTVCMAAVKTGLLNFPAFEFVGDIQVTGIGLDENLSGWKEIKRVVLDDSYVQDALPTRGLNAHKGTFGTATIAAGSINYTGAAYLAASAAYRIGAGLVCLAAPGPLHAALAGQLPEATWLILPTEMGVIHASASSILLKNLEKTTAMLLGPGFGTEDTTAEFLKNIVLERTSQQRKTSIGFMPTPHETKNTRPAQPLPPLVIDADGLKLLARIPEWFNHLPKNTILTPHPGEMAILTGLDIEEIQENRLDIAEKFARIWGHIVVLKGALTVIAGPDGNTCVVPVATPALARAGTGDVLAGIIVGLLAQGLPPFKAASAGAWIHAQAGLIACNWVGNSASVMASDVLDSISEVLQSLG